MSPWTRWQQGKWRCSWRAQTPDHSAQRSHHPFSRNSLPFMNVRHSPKLHFSPHSAPLSSRLGTERVAFCSPGCQKGRGVVGSEEYRLLRCGHAHFCLSTSLGLGLRPATAQESFYESKRFQECKKTFQGAQVFSMHPQRQLLLVTALPHGEVGSPPFTFQSPSSPCSGPIVDRMSTPPLQPRPMLRLGAAAQRPLYVWSAACTAVRAGSSRWRAV